jgi:hypothetical protein
VSLRNSFSLSLISSGIVTLLLTVLPGDSVWWGVALLVAGVLVGIGHLLV